MIFLLAAVVFAAVLPGISSAQNDDSQTITLKDGSRIKGKLIGIQGSTYLIDTPHMGEVEIDSGEIANIAHGAETAEKPKNVTMQPQGMGSGNVQQAQNLLMSDPDLTAAMMELANDPEMAELFKDPTLLMKLQSMDPAEIQNDPRIQKILSDPRMQQIMQKAAQKFQDSGLLTP